MPIYEYDRANCGTFSNFRSLAEYQMPANCPDLRRRVAVVFPAISARVFPAISARSAKIVPREAKKFSVRMGPAVDAAVALI